jgi:hypothetical protein
LMALWTVSKFFCPTKCSSCKQALKLKKVVISALAMSLHLGGVDLLVVQCSTSHKFCVRVGFFDPSTLPYTNLFSTRSQTYDQELQPNE